MEKNNKLEIFGFGLMVIGVLFWISEKYYFIETLNSVYDWFNIILPIGLLIWALGYMKKESINKKQTKDKNE
jgi:hypothetical protein